jgi:hypothetical protein
MKKLLFLILLTTPLLFLNLTGFSQNLPSYVPTNGLVGFWTMNGTHLDSSPNQTPTTNYGVTFGGYRDNPNNQVGIWEPDTNCNTGLVVTQLDTSGLGDGFSLSFWVKLDSIQDCNGPRFLNWSSSFQLGVLQHGNIPPGGLWYGHNNGINNVGMNITYNVLDWNHIIYTYDSDSIRLYINNSLQGSVENTLISNSPGIGTQLRLGHDQSNSGSINGEMDDLGIWNRVLDITEIGNLYGGSCQVYDTITILDTIRYSVTDTLYIDVNLTSTIPLVFENTIKVYPNPTKDFLQIDCGDISTMNGYSIKIINSLSQSLFDEPVTQSPISIDMNGWNGNGLYFLHLIDGSGNITDIRKIVLQ